MTAIYPPIAKRIPKKKHLHGCTLSDDFAWLQNKGTKRVTEYLLAENKYTTRMMAPSEVLQKKLYREFLSRIKQTDTDVPYRYRGYKYYSRTVKGKDYPIYCRKSLKSRTGEQVLIDVNRLAAGKSFTGFGDFDINVDNNTLAYSVDFSGFREYSLNLRKLDKTGADIRVSDHARSFSWSLDQNYLFYVKEDDAKRASQVWRYEVDTNSHVLIFEEPDALFSLSVERTRSEQYIIITSQSATTTEARFLSAANPTGVFKIFRRRKKGHEYYIDHGVGQFFILSNERYENFRLLATPENKTNKRHWVEWVKPGRDTVIDSIDVFAKWIVLETRYGGLPRIEVMSIKDKRRVEILFPEKVASISLGHNVEFDVDNINIEYESFITPDTIYRLNLKTKRLVVLKRGHVKGSFKRKDYEVEILTATADDGEKIPISLVRKKLPKNSKKNQPVLLSGYGSYGYPNDVYFSSARLSLLDRGVAYAIAHVRGGGEKGQVWHNEGKMLKKRNTFTDFIACAEKLISANYTDASKLVIQGGSAGGLLMGAVVNLRPELFCGVIADVPFVDVVNTMLDETLPLTIGEFEEWGNPKIARYFKYMLSYSPYDNVQPQHYPHMLVQTSLNDSQVMYWEPAKYVAKMRHNKLDDRVLLLKTNMDAGHGGASGRYDFLKEIAFEYAFALGCFAIIK